MPDDLREALELAAAAGNRSLHSEIVARLQASFHAPQFTAVASGDLAFTTDTNKPVSKQELIRLVNEAIDARIELDAQKVAESKKK